MTEKTLAGRFLVATPSMKDPFFSKTVILLVGHNAGTGALGLVLNRESSVTREEACRQLGFECTADPSARLGWGGPVANTRGFIVHAPAADGEPLIFTDGELALGASANLLKAIAEGKGPAKSYIVLGCAGWEPGQLEGEIESGAWLIAPADNRIVFDMPVEERYEAALAAVGDEPPEPTDIPSVFRMPGPGHA